MADDDKLSRKAEIDTTNFKTGIAEMNRDMRVLESGFRASAASLGDWANTASGLEMRIKSLNSQMEIQKDKVAATRAEWERIKTEKGEDSRAAQDLEIKLNKETETLGKMQNELTGTEASLEDMKSSSDDAGDSVEESGDKAEDASGKWEGFKSVLSGVGTMIKGTITVVAGLAVAVAGVGASIGALVLKTTDAASALTDLSTQTGISTTKLQEYKYIGDQIGVTVDTITGANARLIRSMDAASKGTDDFAKKQQDAKSKVDDAQAAYDKAVNTYGSGSEKAKNASDKLIEVQQNLADLTANDVTAAFQTLGVSVTDASGNLRSNQDVFNDVIDALGKIPNEAERDALAMKLFGKSAQELNPLIKEGSAGLAEMADKAHEVGAVMDDETVASFDDFGDTLASIKAGLQGTIGSLLGTILPGIQAFADQAGGYLTQFQEIVKGSNGDVGKMAEGVGGLLGQIVTDLAGQAPQLLNAGLGLIRSLLNAIISALPTLLPAAIQIITSLINFIVQALPTLIQAGVQILLTLVDALIANLPMLIDAGLQAIIALALGLAAALPELIPAVVQALITIVQTLTSNIPLLVNAALQLILGLAQGLIAALPVLIPQIPVIVVAILNALIAAAPMIASAGGQLIGALVTGWIGALPLMGDAALKLITGLIQVLFSKKISLISVGKDFINGLIEGVKSASGFLYDAVKTIVLNMILTIKNALWQKSPSRVGMGIGDNFIRSIGLGGMDAVASVEQTFAQATRRLIFATANGFPGGGAAASSGAASSNSENYAFYAPVYFQGSGEGGLGQQIKARRF